MRCLFCGAANVGNAKACLVCGGPLGGKKNSPPSSATKNAPPPAFSNRVAVAPPHENPVEARVTARAHSQFSHSASALVAQYELSGAAPRLVAALWLGENEGALPVFVAENGALLVWDVPRDKVQSLALRRALRSPGLTTGAVVASPLAPRDTPRSALCGAIIATGRETGHIGWQRLETDSGRGMWKTTVLATIQAHRGRISALGIARERLYSAASDGAVILTLVPDCASDLKDFHCQPQVVLEGLDALSCLAMSPDGRALALGGDDGQLQIWQLDAVDGSANRLDWATGKNHAAIKSLTFSPNGNMLVSQDAQGGCCLSAARSGHELQRWSQPIGAPRPVFAPDSRLLALVDSPNRVSLFDAWTGNLRHTLPGAPGEVQTLGFLPCAAPSSETLLAIATSKRFLLWKIAI